MNFTQFKNLFEKKEVTEYKNKAVHTPLVSICIQTYNQASYIKESLDAILSQKINFSIELLLGDDDSTDGTREICIAYAKKYPEKIRLFFHHRMNNISVSGKPTGIFNSLYNIFSSRGKFIAYCDGDDLWDDTYKLQKQVDYLRANPNTSFTYHEVKLIDKNGLLISNNSDLKLSERDFTSTQLKKAFIQPPISTWCFRNQIKDIPIEFTKIFNGDNFWMSLLGNYGDGKYLENIKPSFYRIHPASIWSTAEKSFQLKSKFETYSYLSKYYKRKKDKNLSEHFKSRANNYAKMIFKYYLKRKKMLEIIKFLKFYLQTLQL
ncbi:Glycosyltransferase involved in cell wall bisynthesis [Salegentibacter holothuriorum]|uniref:Glycosyltransferase involved in cell wall bisynthesis n=1 Tax=Salegentibacter holothuriorum TaxID=241145 RepID=A0A1T5AQ71_9FLAO|nr:glycosyltransferase [Salegentibacter holothuriorum]SKB36743.1 Glycosyltransferase involved in cell wall bisynthesis [Salegentibacter holothuriorum]